MQEEDFEDGSGGIAVKNISTTERKPFIDEVEGGRGILKTSQVAQDFQKCCSNFLMGLLDISLSFFGCEEKCATTSYFNFETEAQEIKWEVVKCCAIFGFVFFMTNAAVLELVILIASLEIFVKKSPLLKTGIVVIVSLIVLVLIVGEILLFVIRLLYMRKRIIKIRKKYAINRISDVINEEEGCENIDEVESLSI